MSLENQFIDKLQDLKKKKKKQWQRVVAHFKSYYDTKCKARVETCVG